LDESRTVAELELLDGEAVDVGRRTGQIPPLGYDLIDGVAAASVGGPTYVCGCGGRTGFVHPTCESAEGRWRLGASGMLHRLRAALVRLGRERPVGEVEVDEFFIGGEEPPSTWWPDEGQEDARGVGRGT
jgi:hypothetical protein